MWWIFFFKIHELFAEVSLLGELEEEDEEDEDEEAKFIVDSPGGLVAVFCPLKLFRHTGQVSCCGEEAKQKKTRRVSKTDTGGD